MDIFQVARHKMYKFVKHEVFADTVGKWVGLLEIWKSAKSNEMSSCVSAI